MLGGATCHILPHQPGVPQPSCKQALKGFMGIRSLTRQIKSYFDKSLQC